MVCIQGVVSIRTVGQADALQANFRPKITATNKYNTNFFVGAWWDRADVIWADIVLIQKIFRFSGRP
jgi:hypothetical protein